MSKSQCPGTAPDGTKWCGACLQFRPVAQFHSHRKTFDGRQTRCKFCQAVNHETWRRKNLSHVAKKLREKRAEDPERFRDYERRHNYGLAPGEFQKMLAGQNHQCAICRTDSPAPRSNFAVDHDHETGIVRGLLCTNCNIGIGNLKHSETILLAAVSYLKKSDK